MMASLMQSPLQLALCLETVRPEAEHLRPVSEPSSPQFLAEPALAGGKEDDLLLRRRDRGPLT